MADSAEAAPPPEAEAEDKALEEAEAEQLPGAVEGRGEAAGDVAQPVGGEAPAAETGDEEAAPAPVQASEAGDDGGNMSSAAEVEAVASEVCAFWPCFLVLEIVCF